MGFILFPKEKNGLVNISQITVFPAFRNQDVEDALMQSLLTHLEKTGQKAALTAPYAQRYLKAHPQWSHILPKHIHFTTY